MLWYCTAARQGEVCEKTTLSNKALTLNPDCSKCHRYATWCDSKQTLLSKTCPAANDQFFTLLSDLQLSALLCLGSELLVLLSNLTVTDWAVCLYLSQLLKTSYFSFCSYELQSITFTCWSESDRSSPDQLSYYLLVDSTTALPIHIQLYNIP